MTFFIKSDGAVIAPIDVILITDNLLSIFGF